MTLQKQHSTSQSVQLSHYTVLIVDDEQAILDLLQDVLEDAGYSVLIAHNGCDALALARQIRPDLVLTDVMMPRMDGITLCAELQRDEHLSDLPVIGMSAVRQIVAGFSRFISKPFELEELLRCVSEALAKR
ncbi:hypothetical protein SE17_00375 [Kouleothrix aurantiaca]|jgi:CheY-like chemotaxis protein|uniref:Response regulatory domain-containing protein n=1 Tax=Kouleothrix aurantiaca TaxID=186479 RepID=A0A0N8PTA5_9CHLR|nr:hypothetical protein SE17_00375 [Kouleothrix aurantiaca]